jgi:hypothetical protein
MVHYTENDVIECSSDKLSEEIVNTKAIYDALKKAYDFIMRKCPMIIESMDEFTNDFKGQVEESV